MLRLKKQELLKLRTLGATPKMMRLAAEDKPQRKIDRSWESEVYARGLYMRCLIQDGILKVAFFLPDHMRMGGRNPSYELYIEHKNRQFVTYDCQCDRWLTAKLDMLPWPNNMWESKEKWISKADSQAIKTYLGGKDGAYADLLKYQREIRQEELKERHKRETDPWDADLAQIPKLPKDWNRWVDKVGIQQNYIFYRYTKKGADIGYCTYCGKDVPIKHPRHNADGRCVCCRHKVTFKAMGKAGTVMTTRAIMYLLQRCKDGFVIREFEGYRKYPKDKCRNPECVCHEFRRVICGKNGNVLRAYWWGDYKCTEIRWIPSGIRSHSWSGSSNGKVYKKTIPNLAKNELSQTGLVDMLYCSDAFDPEKYLVTLKTVPKLEQMSKAALPRLVHECMYEYYNVYNRINPTEEHSLTKMLGIDSQELKRLRQSDGGWRFLNWLQYEKITRKSIPDDVIRWFSNEKVLPDDLNFIRNKMSMVQIKNYMHRQMSESGMKSQETLTTWADYLSMAKRFKMDTDDEIIFRARKLRQRHDELVERCNGDKSLAIQVGEILKKYPCVEDVCQSLKGKYEYADKEYTVVVPSCIEDIILEGRNLHHCLSGSDRYWDRIERREAYLLFLRKTSKIDKSYYTLEIEPDGTVRQKRTMFDRQEADIEDAKKFLRKWQQVISKRLSTEDCELAAVSRVLRAQEFTALRDSRTIINTGELAGCLLVDVLIADLMENKDSVAPALDAAA